jgi:hypothetical protein
MKGQYRIVSEIMLFAIGVVIASFVILNYQNLQGILTELTLKDNLLSVSDTLSAGILKAAESNSIVRIRIPYEISGKMYTISVKNDTIILASFENPAINVTQQLFNISQSHNITLSGNILLSSSRYLQIRTLDDKIVIEEWRYG